MANTLLRFKPKLGFLMVALGFHAAVLSLLPLILLDSDYDNAVALKWMFGVILGFILIFTLGVYLRTFYVIDLEKKQLIIYCIFKVKTVSLSSIKEIENSNSPLSGFRYSLSSDDGLTIKEGKYDSFFINPKDQKGFLETLERL